MMTGATGSLASLSLRSMEYAERLYSASKKLFGQGITNALGVDNGIASSNDPNYARQMSMLNQATVSFWLGEYERGGRALAFLVESHASTDIMNACSILLVLMGDASLPSSMFPMTIQLFKLNVMLYLSGKERKAMSRLSFCPNAPFLNTMINTALLLTSSQDKVHGRTTKKIVCIHGSKGMEGVSLEDRHQQIDDQGQQHFGTSIATCSTSSRSY